LGILGVEIFFVLSGFLIGGIIIHLIQNGRLKTPRDLWHFWARRWLRTLPLYYLFFTVYLFFDWTGPSRLLDHLDFLLFWQNMAWPGPLFFRQAWSLSIEEYFYLLFPFLYFMVRLVFKTDKKSLLLNLLLFLTIPLALKIALTPLATWEDFDEKLRSVVVFRLDSIVYGVAAVYIKNYRPELWRRLRKITPISAVFAAAVCLYIYTDLIGLRESATLQTLFFPVVSISVALLLPFFDEWRGDTGFWLKRMTVFTSNISYSIYLAHVLCITAVDGFLKNYEFGEKQIFEYPSRLYPIYTLAIVLLSSLTYYFWERPFLHVRDRIFFKN
jgi:peptidoglycan/LPS O-acetylase OafA/YrhL